MRVMGAVAIAVALGGCTTTRVVQRDGCWVRETKKTLLGKTEELGPCMRPQPSWSDDRLTRLVQECVAQADHRWTVRAIEAWNRKEPLPPQDSQQDVAKACLNDTATSAVTQNETLKERLAEISSDRSALAERNAEDEAHLRESHDRIAEWLGEAAKRPPPVATATATATSDGTATTENGLASEAGTSSQAVPSATPIVPVTAAPAVPAAAPEGERERAPSPALKALERTRSARRARVRKTSAQACPAPAAGPAEPTAEGAPRPAPEKASAPR
jgi:hypothetical protein